MFTLNISLIWPWSCGMMIGSSRSAHPGSVPSESPGPQENARCQQLVRWAWMLSLLIWLQPGILRAQYEYRTNNGTITITKYNGPGGPVIIPDKINGLPVASIGLFAFAGCPGVTNIIIPNSVNTIEQSAFLACANLTSVTIPNSVTHIGSVAFLSCSNLINVSIPNSVTNMASPVFLSCFSLCSIFVDANNEFFSTRDGVLFNKNQTKLLEFPGSKSGSYAIPESVTNIGEYAFYGCHALTNITIPNSVTSMGMNAFAYCSNLAAVTIPASLGSIEAYAFRYCQNLTNVTIPESITSIKGQAFVGCSRLLTANIPHSVTNIGFSAFGECTSLRRIMVDVLNPSYSDVDGVLFDKNQTVLMQFPGGKDGNYTIPTSVTNVKGRAFSLCSGLSSVTIPNSVTSVGEMAFYCCSNLSNLTMPNTLKRIEAKTFSSCSGLTGITIPNSVSVIEDEAFSRCSQLTNVTVPPDVYKLGDGAFSYCFSLTTLTMPTFANVGAYAFRSCSSLTDLTINSSILGNGAFQNCASLLRATMGDNLTNVPEGAFGGCSALTNITLGNGITNIGESAFFDCTSLAEITIPKSVQNIGESAFFNCTSLAEVTIPKSVRSLGYRAFSGCTSLRSINVDPMNPLYCSVDGIFFSKDQSTLIQYPGGRSGSYTIPENVTGMGSCAFAFCTSLTNITLSKNIRWIAGPSSFDGLTNLEAIVVDALNSYFCSVDGVLFDKDQTTVIKCPGAKVGSYIIPSTVTAIWGAFTDCKRLTGIEIPASVSLIGDGAFRPCVSLSAINVDTLNAHYSSLDGVLFDKSQTTLIQLPKGKAGSYTIPRSVTNLADYAFGDCLSLNYVFFQGDAPNAKSSVFSGTTNVTLFCLPGTEGWGPVFAGRPTALWNPEIQVRDAGFGVQSNRFGFTITGTADIPVLVEACTNLFAPKWDPLQSFCLTNGSVYFSDPQWTNSPGGFYRLRSP